jgi:hypothetical protein
MGRNHSISKGSSLASIAEENHVLRLTSEPDVLKGSDKIDFDTRFDRISHRKASIFRGFCSHHDNKLFLALDRHECSDMRKFLIQAFYRSVCFELFQKRVAIAATPILRELDKGRPYDWQLDWQDFVTKQYLGHYGGWESLEQMRLEMEASVLEKSSADFSYHIIEVELALPMTAFGTFQPASDLNGRTLQKVNEFKFADGKIVKDRLHSVFGFCLPSQGKTLIGLCAAQQDNLAVEFMKSVKSRDGNLVDMIASVLLLHVENVFFRPSFVNELKPDKKALIAALFDSGIGEDSTVQDIGLALSLNLFDALY